MTQVCIIFGGANSEHEVSLRSSSSVIRQIPKDEYTVVMIGITKLGRWLLYSGDVDSIEDGSWEDSGKTTPAIISPDTTVGGIVIVGTGETIKIDVVFPVLHGKNGEDGTIQGLLELAGIPYVGCGVLASAGCMDKDLSHRLLVAGGIKKTKTICLQKADCIDIIKLEGQLSTELGYPIFIKPANAGSSVGVTKVKDATALEAALEAAFCHDTKVVAEQGVVGREIECAVMGFEKPFAAAIIGEVAPKEGFYDYNAKYLDDSAALYIPARITDADIIEDVRKTAEKAYKIMGCKGLARVDFFVTEDGEIILNEINTLPGFTSISMFPKMFIASGMSYKDIIVSLLKQALNGQ